MIFLKSLIFILWNVAFGYAALVSVKWFLFNPRPVFVFRKKLLFTPGFLVRKRDWIFDKARDLLQNYLDQAESQKAGYLAKWEKAVFEAVWEKTQFVEGWKLVPKSIKEKIHMMISTAIRDVVRNILRKTIPRMIEQYRLEMQLDDYDDKFSIDFFQRYFTRYIYKPLLIVVLAVNILIGISNMVLYLIIA